jgi:ClpP class serine protease
VAEGRKMTLLKLMLLHKEEFGRFWSGENGLVDKIGGLDAAIKRLQC